MGTTRSFYFVKNMGFTADELRGKLSPFSNEGPSQIDKMLEALMGSEKYAKATAQIAESREHFDKVFGGGQSSDDRTLVAYSQSAKWLPFFDVDLCDGNIASKRDVKKVAKAFGAPVLAFAVYDSDVMFVSYFDEKNGKVLEYAMPNDEDFDEYDDDAYSTDFPEFLLDFCEEDAGDKLKSIWESTEYVFADDRMHDICALLQIKALYDGGDIQSGYEGIFA